MERIPNYARSVIILILFLSAQAYANNEWFEFYNTTRTLGMGGAGIAITSDETSLYRNPANLGSIRDFYGTLLDPEFENNANFSTTPTMSSFDLSSVQQKLDTNRGSYYHAKIQITPSFVMRNFGFGLIYKNEISALTSANGTVMDTKYQSDMGGIVGTNLRLFDGRIKIGVSAKAFNRIEVVNSTLSTASNLSLANVASEGSAIAFDGGLLLQAPWVYLPTIGVVMHDIGDTTFDKRDGVRLQVNSRPNIVKSSTDVAFSLFPIHSSNFRSVWTLEYSDLTNSRNDTDTMKRVHAGIELNANDIFFFRLGYNQRYYTAGFEISTEHLQWQLATYGEEVGTSSSPSEDRRYNTKLSIRF